MRIRIDPVKCEGFGPCNDVIPEVIKLDEWGYALVEGGGEVPPGLEDKAREAVVTCPVHAVMVEE
jgi:ferredoxin